MTIFLSYSNYKKDPDIIDYILNKDYQIVMIFGKTNISDITDRLSCHLTQRLLMHYYLGGPNQPVHYNHH